MPEAVLTAPSRAPQVGHVFQIPQQPRCSCTGGQGTDP